MKIILVNLPWLHEGRFGVRAGSRWPFTSLPETDGRIHYIPFPFFLAYAAALLRKEGQEALLLDAIAQGLPEDICLMKIKDHDPQLVVVETSAPSIQNDIRLIEKLKQSIPEVKIVLCGSHAGTFAEPILRECLCVDYILTGEYEYALLALVNALGGGLNLAKVRGLVYREDDRVIANQASSSFINLDLLPWPQRDESFIYKYNDGFAGLPFPNVQMLASRGCPFHCSFCLWPQTIFKGAGYRKRNHMDVVDEMVYLVERFHFKAVYFDDDIFNADREYVLAMCHEILKRGMRVPWAVMGRADLMDDELLTVMARAGLYAVKYGVESADSNILKECGKNLDLDRTRRMILLSKQLGIKVHLTFCIGLPGESRRTIKETMDFIEDVTPHSLQFSLATPFPGTEYFNYVMAHDLLCSRDWDDYDGGRKCIIKTQELSGQDLEMIKYDLEKKFCR